METWMGVVTSASTPRATINRLQADIAEVLKRPEVQERVLALVGYRVKTTTPEAFDALIDSEITSWRSVVQGARILVDE
jgi:tripartite-type tricarboxylate transporter receptor subunit TctC